MYTDGIYLLFISSGPIYLILFISSGPQRTQFAFSAIEGILPAVIKGLSLVAGVFLMLKSVYFSVLTPEFTRPRIFHLFCKFQEHF